MDWKIEVEEEPKQEPQSTAKISPTTGIDWANMPILDAQVYSTGYYSQVRPPEMYLMSRPCECPPCTYCGGPDGIYFILSFSRNACQRCYGSSTEPYVKWESVPAPKAYQVESPRPGTTALWDFLMRFSFMAGQPKPPAWLKGKIDEWFKATGRGAR